MEEIQGMKVLTDVYDRICDFDALYEAYRCARKGKRYRQDVMEFTANLEGNLIDLSNKLTWECYKVGPYHPFYVTEPKKRLVMSLQFPDRVVQWAIYNVLAPFYDKMFIEDSYACRKNKGAHRAADRLQYWLRQVGRKPSRWYYLKLDISKYFYRVDHEVLKNILRRRVKDEKLMRLLETIIDSEEQKFGLPEGYSPDECTPDMWQSEVGMPIGNLTSQLFANIYLNELDQFCKHELHIHYYVRYMDDVIILSDDKRLLAAWRDEISIFLEDSLRLSLNSKTAIKPVSQGIDFVGYRIWNTHRKLKKQTARRVIRSMKGYCGMMAEGTCTRYEFWYFIASIEGALSYCNSWGLQRRLKRIYVQEFLLRLDGGDSLKRPSNWADMEVELAKVIYGQAEVIDDLYRELSKVLSPEELTAMPCWDKLGDVVKRMKELGLEIDGNYAEHKQQGGERDGRHDNES